MFKSIPTHLRNFFWNPEYFEASLRSTITFIITLVGSVLATAPDPQGGGLVNWEQVGMWTWKGWAARLFLAAIAAGAMRLRAGDKNPEPPVQS